MEHCGPPFHIDSPLATIVASHSGSPPLGTVHGRCFSVYLSRLAELLFNRRSSGIVGGQSATWGKRNVLCLGSLAD